ncbi:MAG: primosomal protein N' [Candidatus Paraimprobicoccus trichonymphae]|uniref:Replication restart protein PriA n=1 Tax=Candidatus Paraimprobicoccus trichonymphae TaxID=3033793 RepID=A0AA48KY49_9FIRM|nr:MAG: primosomal protein N' [Candidatus Paraimprobicoccus trichonymphae]
MFISKKILIFFKIYVIFNEMFLTVKIAIDKIKYHIDILYEYYVPENLKDYINLGKRVLVPFGNKNSLRIGIILEIYEKSDIDKLKFVSEVLDAENLIIPEFFKLIFWMRDKYFCTYFDVVKVILPSNKKFKAKSSVRISKNLEKKVIKKLTLKQKLVYDYILENKVSNLKEICYCTGVKELIVNNLIKNKILESFEDLYYENKNKNLDFKNEEIELSKKQLEIYEDLLKMCNSENKKTNLLYGITGSGKTLILIKLIDHIINLGKTVIFMVPEISLTTQMINIFKSRYNNKVVIIHSGLTVKQRMEEWENLKSGIARIALGTRTAVFAPVENLGLIVMDEEQEHTYKSSFSPKFHTKEIANFRAKFNNALLVLSSATPSIESYYFAKTDRYNLYTLKERYNKFELPKVKIINMNSEIRSGNTGQFSNELIYNFKKNISNNQQSILLLNRRGYHTFIKCKSCNEVFMCPNCNISLNYHRVNNKLICHYCGHIGSFSKICPKCNSNDIFCAGLGTQKVEEELKNLIPEAKILRVDSDTTISKKNYDIYFKDFSDGKYNIIIGTQMISKGLNFPKVTLVGVLNADQSLYTSDFRSNEHTFSLITQVVGRSGRSDLSGRALIQTYSPENNTIILAAKQDYDAFYESEIVLRKNLVYPPFSDICVVSFKGINEERTHVFSKNFFNSICKLVSQEYKKIPLRIMSPTSGVIKKINKNYIYKIIIKCLNNNLFRQMMSELMINFEKKNKTTSVKFSVDINPEIIV